MKLLKSEHFEAWLQGQITFGIDLDKEGDYLGRYLAQHAGCPGDDAFSYLLLRAGVSATPRRLLECLRGLEGEGATHDETSIDESASRGDERRELHGAQRGRGAG